MKCVSLLLWTTSKNSTKILLFCTTPGIVRIPRYSTFFCLFSRKTLFLKVHFTYLVLVPAQYNFSIVQFPGSTKFVQSGDPLYDQKIIILIISQLSIQTGSTTQLQHFSSAPLASNPIHSPVCIKCGEHFSRACIMYVGFFGEPSANRRFPV